MHQSGARMMLVSVVLIVLLGFSSLNTISLLRVMVLLMLAPVFYAFLARIEVLEQAA
jgi:hypothetical protein